MPQQRIPLSNQASITCTVPNNNLAADLDLVKEHLRVDNSDEDKSLILKIQAAQYYFEQFTSVVPLQQTYTQTQRCFTYTNREINLLRWPVTSITSIKYYDSTGVQQTIDPSKYRLADYKPSVIVPNAGFSWPQTDGNQGSVVITFVAGFASLALCPPMYQHAIAEFAGFLFTERDFVVDSRLSELPDGILRLLSPCQVITSNQ